MADYLFALQDLALPSRIASNMPARYPGPWDLTFENAPASTSVTMSPRVRLWFAGRPVPETWPLSPSLAPGHSCSRTQSGTCAPESVQFVWTGPAGEMSSARMPVQYEDNPTLELAEFGFETTVLDGAATASAWQVFAAPESGADAGSACWMPAVVLKEAGSAAKAPGVHLIRTAS